METEKGGIHCDVEKRNRKQRIQEDQGKGLFAGRDRSQVVLRPWGPHSVGQRNEWEVKRGRAGTLPVEEEKEVNI